MSNSLSESSYEHVEDVVVVTEEQTLLQPIKSTSVTNAAMERLLLEAQKESNKSSRISSIVGSPKLETGSASPAFSNDLNQPENPDMEWVWNWSSRPESQPLSVERFAMKHPSRRRNKLSIRNTRFMRKVTDVMEVFPYIVLSHACSFLVGASLMAIYLRKINKSPSSISFLPVH